MGLCCSERFLRMFVMGYWGIKLCMSGFWMSSLGGCRVVTCSSKLYEIRLMDKILHDLKESKLWELRYIPYNG